MQRNCEANLHRFIGKFANLRRETARRNRDATRADAKTPRRVDDANCPHHVVEVRERFAHSHENDIVDPFAAFAFDRNSLVDYFVRVQVARESFQSARAKLASVSATDLCRDANCPSV